MVSTQHVRETLATLKESDYHMPQSNVVICQGKHTFFLKSHGAVSDIL